MTLKRKGKMKVTLVNEKGFSITKEHGFVLEETEGKPMPFDFVEHPEYGNALLVDQEVFFLHFWKKEDLERLRNLINHAVDTELKERK